jgi:nitroreductase
MNVEEAIKTRRSVRNFLSKPVPDELIGELLEACRWAPSAGNRQPWEVIVIKDKKIIKELAETAALKQMWMTTAPIALVMCINEQIARATYGSRGIELYAIQSTAAAIQNILLRAHSLGLGSCWVGAFYESEAKKILNCPNHIRPVAILPIGWPAESPAPPERHDVTDFSHLNKFEA